MSLVQLTYTSCASEEFSGDVLTEILESAVRHNAKNNVTGMLLYYKGNFMQALEGEEGAVDETYRRITEDNRHHHLYLLARTYIDHREFADWSMGCLQLGVEDAARNPAYFTVLNDGFLAARLLAKKSIALEMLKYFSRQVSFRE